MFLDDLVATIAKQLELGEDEVKLATTLLLTIPFAYLHRKIVNVRLKHSYSLIVGVGLAYWMYGIDILNYVGSAGITYLILVLLPYTISPWIVFAVLLAHLSYGHVYRYYFHYLDGLGVDWTLPQMMLVVKLTSFAWAYHDGQLPLETIDRADRKEKRIVELPSLLEYYSYVFFFVGFLSGPFTEFKPYLQFTDRSIFKDNGGEIPSSWNSSIRKIAMVVIAVVMTQCHKFYPDIYISTDAFARDPLWYRIWYILACVELGTAKYYFAWFLGETAANVAGISYNGKDSNGNPKWDRTVMLRLWEFKTCTTPKGLVDHWNIPTQHWLKHYVFLRIIKKMKSRVVAVFATFFVSALWHGFYPGYYLFFLSGAFFAVTSDVMGKNLYHFFYDEQNNPKSALHDVFCRVTGWAITFWTITYIALAFRQYTLERALKAWSSIYFHHHIAAAIVLVLLTLFPYKPKQKAK